MKVITGKQCAIYDTDQEQIIGANGGLCPNGKHVLCIYFWPPDPESTEDKCHLIYLDRAAAIQLGNTILEVSQELPDSDD